jgi:branched-chain amino acid transport system ATP-binding protein
MLFQISDLTVHYQKVAALKGISLGLADGDIVTLIGANGAGKSTTLRAISGLAKPSSGEISFEGRRIDGMRPERIVALGRISTPAPICAGIRRRWPPTWRRCSTISRG